MTSICTVQALNGKAFCRLLEALSVWVFSMSYQTDMLRLLILAYNTSLEQYEL